MKRLLIAGALMLGGCASHRQLHCRFVAVDGHGSILASPTAAMHSHWHKGFGACAAMIQALESGVVDMTVTGDEAGVEVKGSKQQRLKLKKFFDAEPGDSKGVAIVRRPSFPTIGEIAE